MSTMIRLFSIILISYYLQTTMLATDFLSQNVSATSTALGQADVSLANRADGMHSNPAGLSRIHYDQALSTISFHELETDYYGMHYVKKLDDLHIGFGYIHANVSGINIVADTNGDGIFEILGQNRYTGDGYVLAFAKAVNHNIHIGTLLKKIHQNLIGTQSTGYGIDLGIQLVSPTNRYTLGIAIQDVHNTKIKWSNGTTEIIPRTYQVGWSGWFLNNRLLLSNSIKRRLTTTVHTGIQYNIHPLLPLRFGISNLEMSSGFGLTLSPYTINFSYTQSNRLFTETTYKVSFGMNIN